MWVAHKGKKRKGRGGNAHDRAMGKAIREYSQERNRPPSEPERSATPPQSLSPPEDMPWYESTLFWGASGGVIAFVSLYLGFALRDIRWFLFLAWPFCVLALVSSARAIRSARHKHLIRGGMILGGAVLCGGGLFNISRKFPPPPPDLSVSQQLKTVLETIKSLKASPRERTTQATPTSAPLYENPKAPQAIQFMGLGTTTNNKSIPPVTSWLFQFKVVEGPVSHIKIATAGYQVAPRIVVPGITGKFYRAFQHKIPTEKNIQEMTGVMQSGEELQIPPSPMTEVDNSLNIWTLTFIFAHPEWRNRDGAAQDSDECFSAQTQSPRLDASTAWQPCQVSTPSPVEKKFESMSPSQLLGAASRLSILIAKNNDEYSRQLALVKKKFPISEADAPDVQVKEGFAQSKAIGALQNELFQRFGAEECPVLSPLVGEMLFRVSYSEKDWLAFYKQANPEAFPGKSPEQLQSEADGILEHTILGCDRYAGLYVFQQLPSLGYGLSILTTAFKESADYYAASPLESRPLR
jgi:hypothetical protein